MKLKKFIMCALFLTMGFLLHQITPPILFGMKPDFLLIMMFIAIIFSGNDYKMILTVGIVSGILSSLASTFPGGQLPNILDKLVTSHVVYLLLKVLKNRVSENIKMIIISVLGTVISGIVFLTSAFFMVGLPTSFTVLILTVVVPATLINTFVGGFLCKIVQKAMKYSF